ncbi:MAG: trypsin-like peptidase domain-containing protein [Planctomycetes bacterium]|nr:trypsin-like peptidase domain-containing protein [Planctomycetota bacterium]
MIPLRDFSDQLATVVDRVSPALLHVRALLDGRHGVATGSGVVVAPDGYALTNSHVVHGATAVEATLADGRTLLADIAGDDPATDLAVLRLAGSGLAHAELGDSNALRVGHLVLALGSPLGLDRTVTCGIVSALGRTLPGGRTGRVIEGVIQTDAPINPGNSGGPLADADARVVGINSAVVFPAQGLGFAVPSNTASFVLSEILAHGRVRRAWLGVSAQEVLLPARIARAAGSNATRAVALREIAPRSPAAAAGLHPGDLVVAIAGKPVQSVPDLHRALGRDAIDAEIVMDVIRGERKLSLAVRPREIGAAA